MSEAKLPSPLEAHLGYWLRFVSNQVSHAFSLKLEEQGVTAAEWVVMRLLFDVTALAPSILAERLGMTRGAISKISDRLAAKNMLVRMAGDGDRRFQSLALTEAGRAAVPALAMLADRNDEEFFGDLDPAVRAVIAVAMKDIVRRRDLRAVPID